MMESIIGWMVGIVIHHPLLAFIMIMTLIFWFYHIFNINPDNNEKKR
ncbi:hypothetical protein ACFFGV_20830 [Pontibacillus salicampi]|uniref:Uncharacterized protein n=1 Tax=Pontibacillus salicampi TaxID=1449801 RepID=A0ABV6LUL8_9BACI